MSRCPREPERHPVAAAARARAAAPRRRFAPFSHAVRVYYEDTDAEGVVYYANYLRFLERARTEWLRTLGFDVSAVSREHAAAFVVCHVELAFRAPARLDDVLECTVEPADAGASRLVLHQRVLRAGSPLCEGRLTLGCIDTRTWRPRRMPVALRQRLEEGCE